MTAEPLPSSRGAHPARASAAPERLRPHWAGLRLVPSAGRVAPRAPFAVLVLLLLAGALLTALLVNTQLAQDAFRLSDLTKRGNALAQREEVLRRHVEAAEAPSALALRAADLGMVPYRNPLFLRLPDGAVLGAPSAPSQPMIVAPTGPMIVAPTGPMIVAPGTPADSGPAVTTGSTAAPAPEASPPPTSQPDPPPAAPATTSAPPAASAVPTPATPGVAVP